MVSVNDLARPAAARARRRRGAVAGDEAQLRWLDAPHLPAQLGVRLHVRGDDAHAALRRPVHARGRRPAARDRDRGAVAPPRRCGTPCPDSVAIDRNARRILEKLAATEPTHAGAHARQLLQRRRRASSCGPGRCARRLSKSDRPRATFPVPMEAPDGELVRLIAAGAADAPAAEAELCRRFAPRIRLYGLRHLRDEDRARDLVQAVLLAVLQAARGRAHRRSRAGRPLHARHQPQRRAAHARRRQAHRRGRGAGRDRRPRRAGRALARRPRRPVALHGHAGRARPPGGDAVVQRRAPVRGDRGA